MSAITHVRFYPSDWLAGTRGMTAAETGIYITLIAMMYERAGPIAEDHGRLARLCGASNSQFVKALECLISDGKIIRVEGGLFNSRVEKEISNVLEKSDVAKAKANHRWAKNPEKTKADECSGIADAMLTSSQYPIASKIDPLSPKPDEPELEQAVRAYNELASELSLPKVQNFSDTRRRALRKRLAECGGLDGWQFALSKIRGSPFLRGQNNRGWRADFDFLLQAKSFTRLMEGGYDPTRNTNEIADAFAVIDRRIGERRGGAGFDRADHLADEASPF